MLLGDRNNERILRISLQVPHKLCGVDDVGNSKKMVGIGYEEARQNFEKIRERFFDSPVAKFGPCHKL